MFGATCRGSSDYLCEWNPVKHSEHVHAPKNILVRPMLFLDLCRKFIVRVKRWGGALADVLSEPELFVYICVYLYCMYFHMRYCSMLTLKTWDGCCWWIRRIQKTYAEGEWYSLTSDITWPFFLPVRMHNHDGVLSQYSQDNQEWVVFADLHVWN